MSKRILYALDAREFNDRVVSEEDWTEEVTQYVLESDENYNNKSQHNNSVPYLIGRTSNSALSARLKFLVLKIISLLNSSTFTITTSLIIVYGICYALFSSLTIGVYVCFFLLGLNLGIIYLKRETPDFGITIITINDVDVVYVLIRGILNYLGQFRKSITYVYVKKIFRATVICFLIVYGASQLYVFSLELFSNSLNLSMDEGSALEIKNLIEIKVLDPASLFFSKTKSAFKFVASKLIMAVVFYASGFLVGSILERFLRVKFSAKAAVIEMKNKYDGDVHKGRISAFYSKIYSKSYVS